MKMFVMDISQLSYEAESLENSLNASDVAYRSLKSQYTFPYKFIVIND